jgi:acyl-CoA reductase-like NAD-dependent aldehyde dehydrogenase
MREIEPRLSDREVDRIAVKLAERLVTGALPVVGESAEAAPAAALGEGIFATIDDAVEAAALAFRGLESTTLEQRGAIIAAIRQAMVDSAEELASLAHQETGLGRSEDKLVKNLLVSRKTSGPEVLIPQAATGDNGLTLTEYAPYGVIGAITPTTNPNATIICNTVAMVSAGNSIVFNVHPNARHCSMTNIRLLNRAIVQAGGPANVVCGVANPTIDSAQELMRHPGVRLLAVTGGAGVVREAMTSGKRAICAGPGNPPVVVDSTADLELAGRQIVAGGSFDNNIVCTDEKEVIAVDGIVDDLLRQMERAGAYLLDAAELRRLEKVIFTENRGPGRPSIVNKDLLGKNASVILAAAGIEVRGDPRLAVARVANDHPLVWTEQMMPVMPVTSVPDVGQAIELARAAEHGYGHSAGMYSRDIEALSKMARVINTSIFTKNGPFYAGLGEGGEGHTSFTIASPTGEGLTGPISFSRLRRCVLVDHFRIV